MGLFGWLLGAASAEADRFRVVLYDSSQHTYLYVIEMLEQICGIPGQSGYELAKRIDRTGRATVFTGTCDECEHICHLIGEHGPDAAVEGSTGSMRAEVVRA
jgi:ATP-dependent Clp protease adaptor protein ClpS